MSTKILNLDEIDTGVEKSFVMAGETHTMVPLTVEAFIKQSKRLDEIRAGSNADSEENFLFMIDSIIAAFPTVPREALMKLPVPKLWKLVDYINTDLEAEAEEGNAD